MQMLPSIQTLSTLVKSAHLISISGGEKHDFELKKRIESVLSYIP